MLLQQLLSETESAARQREGEEEPTPAAALFCDAFERLLTSSDSGNNTARYF